MLKKSKCDLLAIVFWNSKSNCNRKGVSVSSPQPELLYQAEAMPAAKLCCKTLARRFTRTKVRAMLPARIAGGKAYFNHSKGKIPILEHVKRFPSQERGR